MMLDKLDENHVVPGKMSARVARLRKMNSMSLLAYQTLACGPKQRR